MFERLLVPTDGSDAAERAMTDALEIGERYDADVHVLSVIDSHRYDTSIESAVAPLRAEAEEATDRLAQEASGADVTVTTAVETGRPARQILTYVEDHDVDLVVMGTRGTGGLPKRLLGSVTAYVVRHADVPVLVVPASD